MAKDLPVAVGERLAPSTAERSPYLSIDVFPGQGNSFGHWRAVPRQQSFEVFLQKWLAVGVQVRGATTYSALGRWLWQFRPKLSICALAVCPPLGRVAELPVFSARKEATK